jgi:DnaK suppressor protein
MNSSLTQDQLRELKEMLAAEKKRIIDELSRIARPDAHQTDEWHARYEDMGSDWDENAQEVTTYATNVSLEGTLETRLRGVNRALSRIDEGTYGICEIGGEAIPYERLRVNPETTRCREHTE